MKKKPNWEDISKHLFNALLTCQQTLRAKGGCGMVGRINKKTGAWDIRHWREIVADALEKMPGVTVDRDLSHALDLPARERKRFLEKRKEQIKTAEVKP